MSCTIDKHKMLDNIGRICGTLSNEYTNLKNAIERNSSGEIIEHLYRQALKFQNRIAVMNFERASMQLREIKNCYNELDKEE